MKNCLCKEKEFYCVFCKSVFKFKPRELSCPKHGHLGMVKEIKCSFCKR